MIVLIIALIILCWILMFSLTSVAARADRIFEQLMYESQTGMGGDSDVG